MASSSRNRRSAGLVFLAILGAGSLFASACVDDRFDDGQFLCSPKAGNDECPPEMVCGDNGRCARQPTAAGGGGGGDSCVPLSCEEVVPKCGAVSDGCGQLISCNCWPPLTCSGGGIIGECGCTHQQSITKNPNVLYDDATLGTVKWQDVDQCKKSDDVWATTSTAMADKEISHYLKAADFGFALPDGALVTGVGIAVERSQGSGAGTLKDAEVRVLVKGQPLALVAKKTAAWDATDAVITYGGSAELWDATLIAATDVEKPDFGVAVAVTAAGAATPRIDHIEVTVHFEDPACPGDGG